MRRLCELVNDAVFDRVLLPLRRCVLREATETEKRGAVFFFYGSWRAGGGGHAWRHSFGRGGVVPRSGVAVHGGTPAHSNPLLAVDAGDNVHVVPRNATIVVDILCC